MWSQVYLVSISILDGVTVKTENQPWRKQMIWTGCVRRTRKSKKQHKNISLRGMYTQMGVLMQAFLPIYRTHNKVPELSTASLWRQFWVPISRPLLYRGSVPVFQRYTKKTWFSKRCLPHPCFSLTVKRSKALIKRLHFTLAYIRTYLIKHLLEKLRHL